MIINEHGASLAAIQSQLDDQEKRLERGDAKMDHLNEQIGSTATAVARMEGKLDAVLQSHGTGRGR